MKRRSKQLSKLLAVGAALLVSATNRKSLTPYDAIGDCVRFGGYETWSGNTFD